MSSSGTLGPSPVRATVEPSAAQLRVLGGLAEEDTPVTPAELAARVGGHPNTTRGHLLALAAEGLVAAHRRPAAGRGRPALAYEVTHAGRRALGDTAGLDTAEIDLAGALVEHLSAQAARAEDAIRVGREWGLRLASGLRSRAIGPVERTMELLAAIGFSPRRDGDSIALLTCPLLASARNNPVVVCGLHHGMLEGALRCYGDAGATVQMASFCEPGACRVHLGDTDRG